MKKLFELCNFLLCQHSFTHQNQEKTDKIIERIKQIYDANMLPNEETAPIA